MCQSCDQLCNGCTGAGNTACSACSVDNFLVQGTSTCVAACADYAGNYFADGSTCRECNSACATCGGAEAYNCNSCAVGGVELVDSVVKDPLHCVTSCATDNGTYLDQQSNCRSKS